MGVTAGSRETSAPSCATRLLAVIDAAVPMLTRMSEEEARRRPAPDKWSAAQVIGHLIDSASNNHQRFVRAASSDDLISPRYDQEAWVAVQRYDDAPWALLVDLWASFNRHIAHVMRSIPGDARMRSRSRHSLDSIAWTPVPASVPTTLDYFMTDYVAHLEHHLRQVFGTSWPPSGR